MASFAPETIFHLGPLPVTNTILDTLLVDALIIGGVFYLSKKLTLIPNNPLQNIMESIIETFYSLTESVAQHAAGKIFPYFMSFFLFILLLNWSALIPGVGTIGIREHGELIPLIRGATSDLNVTLGLALLSAFATHMLSIKTIGIKNYLGRYFSLNPINLFIGILEIISEITKVVSLSFRLFGNVFAGEVVLATVSSIFAFVFPLPFLMLEVIVGFVQALVFSMLTMVFMAILTTSHNESH
ncbi:MAG: F0F1 ATP synthase subunit A [Candidatus Parcubacteria bacterium]|nr:F0F1 ATP synthase subunit A [Candidatus Parcubacteria bacterium]